MSPAYLRVAIEGYQVHREGGLLFLDARILHIEHIVQDDLQVVGFFLGVVEEIEIPDSVQTGTVELGGLEYLVVLSGQDEASDQELLMVELVG